jgi:hypothetical protein
MKKYKFSIAIATIYLILYVVLFQLNTPGLILGLMFLLSPIPVLWMVYQILKNGTYTGKDLGKEEFGYQDVDKNKLGMF